MEHLLTLIIYFKYFSIFLDFGEIRWKYFEISVILVLHFLLARISLNHISANFEIKEKEFC